MVAKLPRLTLLQVVNTHSATLSYYHIIYKLVPITWPYTTHSRLHYPRQVARSVAHQFGRRGSANKFNLAWLNPWLDHPSTPSVSRSNLGYVGRGTWVYHTLLRYIQYEGEAWNTWATQVSSCQQTPYHLHPCPCTQGSRRGDIPSLGYLWDAYKISTFQERGEVQPPYLTHHPSDGHAVFARIVAIGKKPQNLRKIVAKDWNIKSNSLQALDQLYKNNLALVSAFSDNGSKLKVTERKQSWLLRKDGSQWKIWSPSPWQWPFQEPADHQGCRQGRRTIKEMEQNLDLTSRKQYKHIYAR